MKLSCLDLTPVLSGESAFDALAHSSALAREVDGLGLERMWLAEHHNAASLACSCPEVSIARIGALTGRIRVGAGGIMLPNHSALKVAETFRVLESMFPGRIDLGLGRAPGTDPRTAALLRGRDPSSTDFPGQLDELLDRLGADGVPRPPFPTTTVAIPTDVPAPELFLLSSSGFGAELAAQRGLGLAFAHHMNPRDAAEAVRAYRASFQSSPHLHTPYAIVSVAAICASTRDEAAALARSAELAMVRLAQGQRDLPFPSVAEVEAHRWTDEERALRRLHRRALVVGDVDRVATTLGDLVERSGADEAMLLTMTHDQKARRESYRLLAGALLGAPEKRV